MDLFDEVLREYDGLLSEVSANTMAQCPRADLNKKSLPRPKTTTA